MFELLAIFIALAGTIIASYYDLKTTEIPDLLPIVMIIAGIVINALDFIFTKNFENLFLSLLNGILFAAIGFSMYFGGQWGGGDAFLLAAVGFLIPKNFFIRNDLPFFFSYLTNLFFLGSIYMIIYSIFYALKNKKTIRNFKGQVKRFSWFFLFLFISFLAISFLFSYVFFNRIDIVLSLLTPTLTCFLMLIWLFSKSVEKSFIKKIPVSQLKVGDVLMESRRWDGITEKEIEKIRKSGKKYVYIKSGICFAPAFPIALIFTILYGNSIAILLNLLSLI
jgi:Flp pilus assembly protein protease CpaA